MKTINSLLLAVPAVSAFPSYMLEGLMERAGGQAGCTTSALCNQRIEVSDADIGYDPKNPTAAQKASAARNHCGAVNFCTVFDEEEQRVSTSGQYAYHAPGPTDIRGPCPGLNAAANHGYLPRNGVANIQQTITGLGQLFGMSVDLAGFLAAYAIAIDGDPVSMTWSIGGPQGSFGLPGVLGKPQGISWSHNKCRCDAFTNNGDAHSLSTVRFSQAYESGMDDDSYDMDKFAREFAKNTHRSIQTNPNYFTGLFSTTLVAPAAYNFVIAFMSNHTAEKPDGYLNGKMFKQWFGVTGDYPNFKWLPGQESIPDNWYRRPSSQQYQAVGGVFGDLIPEFLAYPDSFRFGGNTAGVNTYTGIDISNFTNGAYNADTLFEGDNLACFIYQGVSQAVPDFVDSGILGDALGVLLPKLNGVFGGLSCPQVSKFNNNNLPPYPGRNYSPTGPATNC